MFEMCGAMNINCLINSYSCILPLVKVWYTGISLGRCFGKQF